MMGGKGPHSLTITEIDEIFSAWQAAAERARRADFDVIEMGAFHLS